MKHNKVEIECGAFACDNNSFGTCKRKRISLNFALSSKPECKNHTEKLHAAAFGGW